MQRFLNIRNTCVRTFPSTPRVPISRLFNSRPSSTFLNISHWLDCVKSLEKRKFHTSPWSSAERSKIPKGGLDTIKFEVSNAPHPSSKINESSSVDDVVRWAEQFVNKKHAMKLKAQEINGKALRDLDALSLERWGIPGGPASILANEIIKLKGVAQGLSTLSIDMKNVTIVKIPWSGNLGQDPDVQVASLPEGTKWFTVPSSHLFVRKHYNRLWEHIKEAYLNRIKPPKERKRGFERVLILGNSGIGKTVSLNYFLYRALQDGIPVLFETRHTRYYLNGSLAQSEDVLIVEGLRKYHSDKSVLLLHDHQPRKEPPLIDEGAFTVAPVSPDPVNCKEYRKHDCMSLWMPLPTKSELVAMNSVELQLESSDLEERISLYGPIQRQVFALDQKACQNLLSSKISSFDLGKHYLNLLNQAELPEDKHGLSWWVVHVNAEDNLREPAKIRWASDKIFRRVMSHYTSRQHMELERYLAQALHSQPIYASPPTKEYQTWATLKIASGITLNCFELKLDTINEKARRGIEYIEDYKKPKEAVVISKAIVKIQLEPSEPIPISSLDVAHIVGNCGTLFFSTNPTEPLCDASVLTKEKTLLLFQMTIGGKHEISQHTLNKYMADAKLKKLTKMVLIFVVPYKSKFELPRSEFNKVVSEQDMCVTVVVLELRPAEHRLT